MKLINNTKTKFVTSKGLFPVGKIMDFDGEEGATLLRYEGITKVDDLEVKSESKPKSKSKKKED